MVDKGTTSSIIFFIQRSDNNFLREGDSIGWNVCTKGMRIHMSRQLKLFLCLKKNG